MHTISLKDYISIFIFDFHFNLNRRLFRVNFQHFHFWCCFIVLVCVDNIHWILINIITFNLQLLLNSCLIPLSLHPVSARFGFCVNFSFHLVQPTFNLGLLLFHLSYYYSVLASFWLFYTILFY